MNKNLIMKTPQTRNRKSVSSKTDFAENHKWSRKRLAARSLLLAALAISRPSSSCADEPNLVVNGGFEEPADLCSFWIPVPEGSGFITGWNVNVASTNFANGGCNSFPGYSHSVDLLVNPGGLYVHRGGQSIDIAGTYSTPGDSIYQDIPTRPGRNYTLTFYTSSNGEPKPSGVTVEWDGVPIATLSTPALGEWSSNSFSVYASSEVTRLRFIDNVAGGQGSILDSVSVVGPPDQSAPVVDCPPSVTVPFGSVPPAATNVAQFTAQGGSISDDDPEPSVASSDEVSGTCPTLVTRTYTVTDTDGNATQCQQLIMVENLFATSAVVWYPPLARFNNAADTNPSADTTLKYVFKLGATIPVKIRAQGCDGRDLTSYENIIGMIEVLPVSGCNGVADANALPIDFNGLGGADGLMDKVGGYLRYNINTKTLPRDIRCYLIKATVIDLATGESLSEFLPIQRR